MWLVWPCRARDGGVSLPAHAESSTARRRRPSERGPESRRAASAGALPRRRPAAGPVRRAGASRARRERPVPGHRSGRPVCRPRRDDRRGRAGSEECRSDEVGATAWPAPSASRTSGESCRRRGAEPGNGAKRDPAPSAETAAPPAPRSRARRRRPCAADVRHSGVPPASTGQAQPVRAPGRPGPGARGDARRVTQGGGPSRRDSLRWWAALGAGGGRRARASRPRRRLRRGRTRGEGGGARAARRRGSLGRRPGARLRARAGPYPHRRARSSRWCPSRSWRRSAVLAALSLLLGGGYLSRLTRARRLAQPAPGAAGRGRPAADRAAPAGAREGGRGARVGRLPARRTVPAPAATSTTRSPCPADAPRSSSATCRATAAQALAHTAFMRYTLRAYLERRPRAAAGAAGGRARRGRPARRRLRHGGGRRARPRATARSPTRAPGTLRRSSPAPRGTSRSLAGSSPPIGWGLRTGLRQTTVPLPAGAVACLYTDGLAEATTVDGILGRPRLAEIVAECGRDATADDVLARVAAGGRWALRDDMAACLIAPVRGTRAPARSRAELLEVGPGEVEEGLAGRFLDGVRRGGGRPEPRPRRARSPRRKGGALITVRLGAGGPHVEVRSAQRGEHRGGSPPRGRHRRRSSR